ncbi:hypothetical protein BOSP111201_05595 [Bordetella sputigena]|uniref:hypothetical protein n=1 Tax=Bordetella sputigena TaxID=1416810 RepID=UPI0039F085BB
MHKPDLSGVQDKASTPSIAQSPLDHRALVVALANAYAMAAEDRATISALQDIVAQQAVEIAQLRAHLSLRGGRATNGS